MSQFFSSHTLMILLMVSASSIPGFSDALEVPGLRFNFPVFNTGSSLELREPSHASASAKTSKDLDERQAGLSRNQGRAGTSRNILAFGSVGGGAPAPPPVAAGRSFSSPDSMSKKPGALAEWLGASDLPIDNMFIFGSLGFLVGYAKSKLSKVLIAVGLIGVSVLVMSKNGYVTIHWGKVQRDIAGNETYKYIKSGRVLQLLPPSVQDAISRSVGVVQSAIENNKGGLAVAISSFLSGMTIGSRA